MGRHIAWSAFVLFLLAAAFPVSAGAASPPGNAACLTCHAAGGEATSIVDFTAAGVDVARCGACHWLERHEFDAYHQQANIPDYMSRDCSACHANYGFPTRTSYFGAPGVYTVGGWFQSASSLESPATSLHAIHANGSWPSQIGASDSSACSSCHGHASCDACHAAPTAHAEHTLSPPKPVNVTTLIGRKSGDGVSDTYLYAYRPTSAYGTGVSVYVGRTNYGEERSILSFPLSRLPAGATVNSATLQLTRALGGSTFPIRAYRLRRDADVSAANWNQYASGSPWGVAGAKDPATDYFASPFSLSTAGNGVFDVTALLQAAIAAGEPSLDLVLVDPAPVSGRYMGFYSSDTTQKDWMPLLDVSASTTASVYANPPLTYRVAAGLPFGVEALNLTYLASVTCVNGACHSLPVAPTDGFTPTCGSCHPDRTTFHGYDPVTHTGSPASSTIVVSGVPYGPLACDGCHAVELKTEHAKTTSSGSARGCVECHPTPRDSFAHWDHGCAGGGCHTAGSAAPMHEYTDAAHVTPPANAGCFAGTGCHRATNLAALHSTASTVVAGQTRTSCGVCHTAGVPATRDCIVCHGAEGTGYHVHLPGIHLSPTSSDCFGAGCHPATKSLPDAHALYVGPGSEFPAYATTCELCHANTDPDRIDWDTATAACTGSCHSGPEHSRYATSHTITAASSECTPCHGSDLTGIHGAHADPGRCAICHASAGNFARSAECASCHADKSPVPTNHFPAPKHVSTSGPDCSDCHSLDLAAEHAKASSGSMSCADCHTSAKFAALAGPWDGKCAACHGADYALTAAFCTGCHVAANGTYAGSSTFAATKHGSVTVSTLASVRWPGTTYAAGSCVNCHGTHAASTRLAGDALCHECHDAAGTTKPASYSYQGETTYTASAHSGLGSCGSCHAVHGATSGATAVASALTTADPGVCAGSSTTPGCHASPANSAHGVNVLAAFSSGTSTTTHHEVYAVGSNHIVCSSCHDPHADTASRPFADPAAVGRPLASATDRFRDASGNVYTLVGARHDAAAPTISNLTMTTLAGNPAWATVRWDTNEPATGYLQYGTTAAYGTTVTINTSPWTSHAQTLQMAVGTTWHWRVRSADGVGNTTLSPDATYRVPWTYLTAGPTLTGASGTASYTLTWTTAAACESWIDWGTSAAYGSSVGTSVNTTSHVVTLSGLTPGTYHVRARSQRAGDVYLSGDYEVYVSPAYATAPVLTPVPGNGAIPGPLPITFSWSQPNTTYAPFTYQLHLWDPYRGYDYVSSWLTTNTMTMTLDGDHDFYWTVQARDKDGMSYPLSASSYFYLYYYTSGGSCPFLFTGTGTGWAFEADNFTAGRLGGPTATGYQQANPNDAYILKNVPAAQAGSLEFKLVEERREVDYLDSYGLFAVDAPAGTQVYAEKAVAGKRTFPPLASALHTVSGLSAPLSAVRTDTGADISAQIARQDDVCAALSADAETTFGYKTVELDLGPGVATAPQVKIVMDAISEFPVTPAGIARRFTFGLPTRLEVQGADGTWRSVAATVGSVPTAPEFERPYVFDLTNAMRDTTGKVRFTYLFRTLIDWIALDTSVDAPLAITEVPLSSAQLRYHGVDEQSGTEAAGAYVYDDTPKPSVYSPGDYTRFGEVGELLGVKDDKFVIMGQGDEISLAYTAPAEPAAGTTRTFVFSAYGYYKDGKTDLPQTVEPLPFAAMSNYPYAATESYPGDAEHQAYRDTYNTRHQDGGAAPEIAAAVDDSSVDDVYAAIVANLDSMFALDEEGVGVASDGAPRLLSVDTDRIVLSLQSASSSVATAPAAGWDSASALSAPPTPSTPGAAVASATVAKTRVYDGQFWRTELLPADGVYNWQVARFSVPNAALAGATSMRLQWWGHGEPTPGYPTKLYLWDFQASQWVPIGEGTSSYTFAVDFTGAQASVNANCLGCHTATPPAGASGAAAFNTAASWSADFHGGATGGGNGGTLKAPYLRDAGEVGCDACHDPHGSSNLWHIKSTINGSGGISVSTGTGTQLQPVCAACHATGPADWHSGCTGCHNIDHSGGPTSISGACSDCHGHGRVWYHPATCHGCDGSEPGPWRTF